MNTALSVGSVATNEEYVVDMHGMCPGVKKTCARQKMNMGSS